MNSEIQVGSGTHVGAVRTENQDAVGYFRTDDGVWTVLMVCDGMGGHAAGERASSLAVEVIGREFANRVNHEGPTNAMVEAIRAANTAVYQEAQTHPERKGMGTTVAMLVARGDEAYLAHVGDSRIYRVHAGGVERLTVDHTSVQRMVDAGILTPEQAESHPEANIISRCVGGRATVEPEVRGPEAIRPGDRFVLCSDGLHGPVKDEEIAAMVWAFPPQEAVDRLIRLANARGAPDNVSVQVLYRTGKDRPNGRFQPERFRKGAVAESGGLKRALERLVGVARSHPFVVGFLAGVVVGGTVMRLWTPTPTGQAPGSHQREAIEKDEGRGFSIPPKSDQGRVGPFEPATDIRQNVPDPGPSPGAAAEWDVGSPLREKKRGEGKSGPQPDRTPKPRVSPSGGSRTERPTRPESVPGPAGEKPLAPSPTPEPSSAPPASPSPAPNAPDSKQ